MSHKYKTTFASNVSVLKPNDNKLNEARASVKDLKELLPYDTDPEKERDLTYIVGNLAVASVMNLNDDIMDCATAAQVYSNFEKKQLNTEHNREQIVGFILKSRLTELNTDKILSSSEALASGQPFYISILNVLWNVVNPGLCQYIVDQSVPGSEDFGNLSLSFEVGFDDYDIGVVLPETRCICNGSMIVKRGSKNFDKYDAMLRINGGSGKDGDMLVGRILSGNITPLGAGIVRHPAAQVKGILSVDTNPKNDTPVEIAVDTKAEVIEQKEIILVNEENNKLIDYIQSHKAIFAELFNKLQKFGVSFASKEDNTTALSKLINNYNMKPEVIQEAFAALKKADTLEALKLAVAGVNPIADAILAENARYEQEAKDAKVASENADKAKADAIAASEKASADLAELKKELDGIKLRQASIEAQAKFDSRIAAIVEEYELSDEERAIVVAQIKDLDDAGFTAWQTTSKVMLKDKSKKFKADKKKKMEDEMAKAGVKVTVDASTLDFSEILANVKEQPNQHIENNIVVKTTQKLQDEYAEAFGGIITVDGKKLNEPKQ